jgi:LPXTG-motif cell wall-anchored protein
MKLRQTLAMGAVSALIAPALAIAAAPAALADTAPSLQVDAPKVIGAGGQAVEFTAEIKGLGEREADLVFELEFGDYFKAHRGLVNDLSLQYFHDEEGTDDDEWRDIRFPILTREGERPTAIVDELFTGDKTLKLRASVAAPPAAPAEPTPTPTATLPAAPADPASAPASARAKQAKALAKRLAARQLEEQSDASPGTRRGLRPCDTARPGFTLISELRTPVPRIKRSAVTKMAPSTPPPPFAHDEDTVKVAVPSIDLQGLEGDVVAGGQPKVFKATLCNPSESAYAHVLPGLAFGPFESAAITDKDLTLEISPSGEGKFVPVKLTAVTEDGETLLYANFDIEDGLELAKGENKKADLRIAAAKGAKLGEWGAVGTVELPDTPNVEAGYDRASFRVVAPGSTPSTSPTPVQPTAKPTPAQPAPVPDDLAHTGGNLTAGVAGIGLLLAGAVAFLVARRRRRTAA